MAGITLDAAKDEFMEALAGAKNAQTKIGKLKTNGRSATVHAVSMRGDPNEIIQLAKRGVNLNAVNASGNASAKDVTGAAAASAVAKMYRDLGIIVRPVDVPAPAPTVAPDGQE